MARRYGRAPRGRRAYGKVPANPDPNITLVMGLGLRGVVAPWAFKGAMNGEHFDVYVRQVLMPELKRGDVVIVDGLGAHRLRGVRQALRTRGVRYWILPAYSPDLSPVENCGSKVKEALRAAAPRTVPAVYDAMVRAVDKVFRQDAQGWFALKGYVRRPRRPTRRRPVRSQAPARVGRARAPPNAGCTALERKPL
jgi:transposase